MLAWAEKINDIYQADLFMKCQCREALMSRLRALVDVRADPNKRKTRYKHEARSSS